MVSDPNDSQRKALEKVAQAAAHSADCSGGFIAAGPSGSWKVVAQSAVGPALPFESSTETWLKFSLSDRDLVIVDEVMGTSLPAPLHHLYNAHKDFIVAVALRSPTRELIGVLFVWGAVAQQRLSAAQTYALQTHAALASQILQTIIGGASGSDKPSIERLRLLKSVVVNAKDAILITQAEPIDAPGPKIVYCNPAFLATTGFSLDQVLGMTPRILHCEETNRDTLDLIRAALEKWEPVEVELVNARSDGTRFWVQLSIVPVANERGWFTHWVSVQRDISERKDAELLLLQTQADREAKVALETRLLERERIERELSYAAFHDGLTSLHNRAYLMNRLLGMFNEADHGQAPPATVLFLDLDRFKFVNDSLGHRAGDILLSEVARRLEALIEDVHVFARVGGDEFAILLMGHNQSGVAVELAQRIVTKMASPVVIHGQNIFTSCSLGIVSANSSHSSPEDLLRDADVAMYAAKKEGRGRWAIFDASMRKAAVDTLLLQNALRQAIAHEQFWVAYQPIYDVTSGEIRGVEALVRWLHPQLGHIPPDTFIGVAEEIGVIQELGAWVMYQACSELQRWKAQFGALALHLNVNVSGTELNRPGYVAWVADILQRTGVDARELQIEITESVFIDEPDEIAKVLESLRTLGIRVALDDFGTGYSSLGYIDRYPIDAIKIDRSFVSRMMSFERSDAIVKSILSLGRALKIGITAEGVETVAQLQHLREMACPFVQGYLLSPPVTGQEMTALLETWSAPRKVDN
ncbi:putative bifunctional diguanylate cyclase/phosphodiesterase [Pseudomonas cerasi]|uniref:Sensory box/GGDEF domain/EAL domain protein n=1 Tax=Pseudomonas cerasi TaxID=1583341 RepID=A0A193SST9_9PSED|nr:GGDEF domain-containing phosphodiesterase [Pseudomonas cerasi]CZT30139.1 sensory box/GGDEF domain/EAL domain protein [Pseudomonas cerasi]SOS21860.1 sensory box/GGDEF domain/EAL domain protein [Pseudomonas cerasi]